MYKKVYVIIILCLLIISAIVKGISIYSLYKLDLVDVYISNKTIGPRKKITENDLEILKYPRNYLSPEVILDKQHIVDHYNLLNNYIPKGSFFYYEELEYIKDSPDYPLSLLNDNQTLFTIYANNLSNGINNITNFQVIDLYLTINIKNKTISDLLISNLRIVALYNNQGKAVTKEEIPSEVVIALDKKFINILNNAIVIGKFSIYPKPNNHQLKEESVLNKKSKLLIYLNR